MEAEIKYRFWYPVFADPIQKFLPGFDGKTTITYSADNTIGGHIMIDGGELLCGTKKRRIVEKTRAITSRIYDKPLASVHLCKKCLQRQSADWRSTNTKLINWITGKPIR